MKNAVNSDHGRPLSRRRQWLILALVTLAALAAFLGGPPVMRLFAPTPPPTAPAAAPGTFSATAEQWATLRFALARRIDFAATQEADGKIAANDERSNANLFALFGACHANLRSGGRLGAGWARRSLR